jgi:hypothetical protein
MLAIYKIIFFWKWQKVGKSFKGFAFFEFTFFLLPSSKSYCFDSIMESIAIVVGPIHLLYLCYCSLALRKILFLHSPCWTYAICFHDIAMEVIKLIKIVSTLS